MVTMTTLRDSDCPVSTHLISFFSYLLQRDAKIHFDITIKITKYCSQRDYKNKGPSSYLCIPGII